MGEWTVETTMEIDPPLNVHFPTMRVLVDIRLVLTEEDGELIGKIYDANTGEELSAGYKPFVSKNPDKDMKMYQFSFVIYKKDHTTIQSYLAYVKVDAEEVALYSTVAAAGSEEKCEDLIKVN